VAGGPGSSGVRSTTYIAAGKAEDVFAKLPSTEIHQEPNCSRLAPMNSGGSYASSERSCSFARFDDLLCSC
jgi:hypothetical protein